MSRESRAASRAAAGGGVADGAIASRTAAGGGVAGRAIASRTAAGGGVAGRAIASRAATSGGAASAPGAVHFEIGLITLHGFPPAHRARFLASLQASLTELGTGGDWSHAAPRQLGRVDAGPLRAGASPEQAAELVTAQIRAAIAAPPHREPAR